MASDETQKIFINHHVGLRNVGSYQVSGHPFLLSKVFQCPGDEKKIQFPFVTKKLLIVASGSANQGELLRIHFNSTGGVHLSNASFTEYGTSAGAVDPNVSSDSGGGGEGHFFPLRTDGSSLELDIKCKEVFISTPTTGPGEAAGFNLYASLTNIPAGSMFALTGSGLTDNEPSLSG
tara:strand:- start:1813 stop:2343 length:531 start_codon:yes stop_codon:yes gene_type:complete